MKKLLLFITLFLCSYTVTNAWYYLVSTKTYSSNSGTNNCWSWEVASTSSTSVVTSTSAGTSGTFYCLANDTTGPSSTVSYSPSTWNNWSVTVSITCSDGGSSCDMYSISGWSISGSTYSRTFTSNTSGSITIRDKVGNTSAVSYNVDKIDKTAPVWFVSYSDSSATNQPVTVTIACSDTDSSCDMYAISGWTVSWNNYSKTFTSDTSGSITIKDTAGNTNSVAYSITNIDTTMPTTSISYSETAHTSWTVTATVSCNDAKSGCNMSNISGWSAILNTYTKTFTANATGSITVKDAAWNAVSVPYSIANIDTTPPNCSAVAYSNTNWTNTDITVSIPCSDNLAGCDMYDIPGWTISGNTYSKTFPANTSGDITLKDKVGNTKIVAYSIANIDKTAPALIDITWNWVNKAWADIDSTNNEDFSINVSNNLGSPIVSIEWYFENKNTDASPFELTTKWDFLSSWNDTLTVTRDISEVDNWFREYSFKVSKVCDQAGNCTNDIALFSYNIVWEVPVIVYTWSVVRKEWISAMRWNYDWVVLKVSTWGLDYVYSIPSITTTNTDNVSGLSDIINSNNFVYDSFSNTPYSYTWAVSYDWLVDYDPQNVIVYQRTARNFFDEKELRIILNNIIENYRGTSLSLQNTYEEILYENSIDTNLKILSNELNGDAIYQNYESTSKEWKKADNNCMKPDVLIWDQVWAWCNSTLWNGTSHSGETCYNYYWSTTTCSNVSTTDTESDFVAWQSNNIFWKKYTLANAASACPTWWHVPTDSDWKTLESVLGCDDINTWWVCNNLGWKNNTSLTWNLSYTLGLPLAGKTSWGNLDLVWNTWVYWTSTWDSSSATIREFYYNSIKVKRETSAWTNAYSVRCIKN